MADASVTYRGGAMSAARLLVRLQLALARLGWMQILAGLLGITALLAWAVWLPVLQRADAAQSRDLHRAQVSARQPPPVQLIAVVGPDRVAEFYDMLGERRHAEQQLRTLFALAKKNGVDISAAEYQTGFDKNSQVHRWQIALPVKGTYPALRRFAEQVLLAIPFAALDELRFKREAIATPLLDARLHFTFYLGDGPVHQQERER